MMKSPNEPFFVSDNSSSERETSDVTNTQMTDVECEIDAQVHEAKDRGRNTETGRFAREFSGSHDKAELQAVANKVRERRPCHVSLQSKDSDNTLRENGPTILATTNTYPLKAKHVARDLLPHRFATHHHALRLSTPRTGSNNKPSTKLLLNVILNSHKRL
jgi:hypothetical protein